MAKRFSDTEKWKKVWFRRLSPVHKVFWEYLRDNCNHAGIWDVDFELAQFQIGAELKPNEIIKAFGDHVAALTNKKWFILDFIPYQYNCNIEELNPTNRVHKSVINCLKKYKSSKGLTSPLDSAIDIFKDKEQVKDKKIYSETIQEIVKDFYILKSKNHKNAIKVTDSLIDKSCDAIDKLNRIDEVPLDYIFTVITRSIADEFWRDQIMSLSGLRKKRDGVMKFTNLANQVMRSDYVPEKTKKLIAHRYDCPSCGKEYHPREKNDNTAYPERCSEPDCQKVGLGRDGKTMVGYELKYIEPIYKDIS